MKTSTRADITGGLLIALLGIGIATMSRDFAWFGTGGRVGSGLVPGFAGLIMAVLGTIIALKAHLSRDQNAQAPIHPTDGSALQAGGPPEGLDALDGLASIEEEGSTRNARSTLGVLFSTLVAIYLTPRIGFLAAFGLLILCTALLIERTSIRTAIIFTAATIAVTWAIFVYALEVPLPSGVFGSA